MKSSRSKLLVLLLCTFLSALSTEYLGDSSCTLANNAKGRCIKLKHCKSALEDVARSKHPQTCGFDGKEPIVCCETSEKLQKSDGNEFGAISRKKCLQYENFSSIAVTNQSRNNFINGKVRPVPAVLGGIASLSKEFPHMVALGFGDLIVKQWGCGGSLISEDFVLTAAHCLYSRQLGELRWARLGDLDLHHNSDDALPQDFSITKKIPHPNYRPPLLYNDIALVQLDRKVTFNDYAKPICLQDKKALSKVQPIAAGWGHTQFGGQSSDVLMKVVLSYYDYDSCKKTYSANPKRLPKGIDDETQICAGGKNEEKDTCQGDSGGPLHGYDGRLYLVGITSFGKACGLINTPGVYTRVSHFVPWIESVVWPN